MDINLEYYKIFYYVGGTGSISGAAAKLCISQPAVSQAVKQLEKDLSVKLFTRGPRGVSLTAEGRILYSYVKQGYEYIMLGENKLKQMMELDCGEVRIGASDMTLRYYLLDHLEAFHEMYPGIKVSVTNAPTPETLKFLREGKIDFGIVSGPVSAQDGIRVTKVRQIQDIFIGGNRFLEYRRKTIPLKVLEQVPIVSLEPNTSTRKYIDEFLLSNGVKITPEFEIATSDMIVQFVVKNFGIGCVVRDFAAELLGTGKIFELQMEKKIPQRAICMAVNEQMPMSSAGKRLYELLLQDVDI